MSSQLQGPVNNVAKYFRWELNWMGYGALAKTHNWQHVKWCSTFAFWNHFIDFI